MLTRPLLGERVSALSFDAQAGVLRFLTAPRWEWGLTLRTLAIGDLYVPGPHGPSVTKAAFSPDGRTLATVTVKGTKVTFRTRETGSAKSPPHQLPELPCGTPTPPQLLPCTGLLAFSADGKTLAYAVMAELGRKGNRFRLGFWDVDRPRLIERRELPVGTKAGVSAMTFTPDGAALVLTEFPRIGNTWIWNRRRRALERSLPGVDGSAVAVFPDGDRLLTGQGHVRSYPSGRADSPTAGPGALQALLFSPDGSYFAGGTANGQIHLWDGRIRRRLGILAPSATEPPPEPSPAYALAFSADSRLLAAADLDGVLQIWDTSTRRPLGIPLPTPGGGIEALAFSADGRALYAAGLTSGLQTYDVGIGHAVATVCGRIGQGLSRGEWAERLPGVPYRESCPEH
ncbi:hypothetical protein [Streptomyces sp. NPDC093111]|uniref:WD40 repeat domain-containing protein n=1 Tax=Streptomyces sp. NPDC093111 TaxID=3154978 RepID=UPI00343AACA1